MFTHTPLNLQKFSLLAPLVLLLFAISFSQVTLTAYKIPDGAITIDGKLDEACWANATKIRIDSSKVLNGTISGNADCYADISLMWGNAGFYIGVWFHDNLHSALNSTSLDGASMANNDDGIALLFNADFGNVWSDTGGEVFAPTSGVRLEKGFGNLSSLHQYAFWSAADSSAQGYKMGVYDAHAQDSVGWPNVFTSEDGNNYQYESLFKWNTAIANLFGIPNDSHAIALNVYVNDNDGHFSVDGYMSLTAPFPNGTLVNWAKVF